MQIIDEKRKINRIINHSKVVFLMAHKDLDLDALGSCIGFSTILKRKRKDCYIIIDDKTHELGVEKVLRELEGCINIINSEELDKYLLPDEKNRSFQGGEQHEKNQRTQMGKKDIVIGMLLAGMVSGCGRGSSFTKEQAMVKYGYDDLKGSLLDPESLIIYDCYVCIKLVAFVMNSYRSNHHTYCISWI